jgi:aminoglycoside/choline kinase family phosphotransferase
MPERLNLLKQWLEDELDFSDYSLKPASSDASFRRYFRVTHDGSSFIVMDAPPEKENTGPFVTVARLLLDVGVNVPEILDESPDLGFLLLSDLGSRLYLDALNGETVERLYGDALGALAAIQICAPVRGVLPDYDHALLMREMGLFRDWLVGTHLGIVPNDAQSALLEQAFARLTENALGQPQVCVHRDYHSRNLMVCPGDNPGILDFQDAVRGPITYDLVSLLRDSYIAWPQARVVDWALEFRRRAAMAGLAVGRDDAEFLRWFDLVGVQRHLKVGGIFARLWHRDGKPGYLPDVPRTLGYIEQACARHADLAALGDLVRVRVLPAMQASLEAPQA